MNKESRVFVKNIMSRAALLLRVVNFELFEKRIRRLQISRNRELTATSEPVVSQGHESFDGLKAEWNHQGPLFSRSADVQDVLDGIRFVVEDLETLRAAAERRKIGAKHVRVLEQFAVGVEELQLFAVLDDQGWELMSPRLGDLGELFVPNAIVRAAAWTDAKDDADVRGWLRQEDAVVERCDESSVIDQTMTLVEEVVVVEELAVAGGTAVLQHKTKRRKET